MPYQFIQERWFTTKEQQTPWVQHATPFQDIVIRCVRYAFANIPATIGKVFFSKPVALSFFTFRKLRHFLIHTPIHWHEVSTPNLKGLWIIADASRKPDVAIYYCHGGGFSMGSSYFYLEFLLAWVTILKEAGYSNPAIFALEYTLVPEKTYPTQLTEARIGYEYVLARVSDSSRIVVSGDSAGATLILALLLSISEKPRQRSKLPGLAIPISPWTVVVSDKNQNTPSDYLNADSLALYGSQYIGRAGHNDDELVSPGMCTNLGRWKRASPTHGWMFIYGAEEVFAPATRELVSTLKRAETEVVSHEEKGWVHAWPVVKLFLCNEQSERQSGIRSMVKFTKERIPPSGS